MMLLKIDVNKWFSWLKLGIKDPSTASAVEVLLQIGVICLIVFLFTFFLRKGVTRLIGGMVRRTKTKWDVDSGGGGIRYCCRAGFDQPDLRVVPDIEGSPDQGVRAGYQDFRGFGDHYHDCQRVYRGVPSQSVGWLGCFRGGIDVDFQGRDFRFCRGGAITGQSNGANRRLDRDAE